LAEVSNVSLALEAINNGKLVYCKFLSANDTGDTGSHQYGIYIAKNSIEILFDKVGVRGSNMDKFVKIKWQNDFETDSRFIYYGTRTRNEYRITRFGNGFPFLGSEHTGDLFIFIKEDEEYYSGFFLGTEEEIDEFLGSLGMSPTDTGSLINSKGLSKKTPILSLDVEIEKCIFSLEDGFPSASIMSCLTRDIYDRVFNHANEIELDPDKRLVSWIDTEYSLFKALEKSRYDEMLKTGFSTIDEFINAANSVLNRRKSRAGKSLENHLSAIFDGNELEYTTQGVTEGNRRPDFIFPSIARYHDNSFSSDKLVFLGSKTTCKDRWRQVINEASRISTKHLFTLQQGISAQQLTEMEEEHVQLVVPTAYLGTFPKSKQDSILTLKRFIELCKAKNE
jgi:type II restriction enzyme